MPFAQKKFGCPSKGKKLDSPLDGIFWNLDKMDTPRDDGV
jgi:hypothetical protein